MEKERDLTTDETPEVDAGAGSPEQRARREFLKQAGKVAVAAPALALILRAESVQARGFNVYRVRPPRRPLRRRGRRRRGWLERLFDRGDRH